MIQFDLYSYIWCVYCCTVWYGTVRYGKVWNKISSKCHWYGNRCEIDQKTNKTNLIGQINQNDQNDGPKWIQQKCIESKCPPKIPSYFKTNGTCIKYTCVCVCFCLDLSLSLTHPLTHSFTLRKCVCLSLSVCLFNAKNCCFWFFQCHEHITKKKIETHRKYNKGEERKEEKKSLTQTQPKFSITMQNVSEANTQPPSSFFYFCFLMANLPL